MLSTLDELRARLGDVLLPLRTPFRMPAGERLFRLVWLGPVGAGNEQAAVASLENRVAELERWRNELAGTAPQA